MFTHGIDLNMTVYRSAILVFVIWSICGFSQSVYAQTISSEAHGASRAWAEIQAKETGIYKGGGYVFVVAILPWDGNARRLEARATLITHDLLLKYFATSESKDENRRRFVDTMLELREFSNMAQRNLHVPLQVLENGRDWQVGETYRRVVAYRETGKAENIGVEDRANQLYATLLEGFVSDLFSYPEILERLELRSLALIAERRFLSKSMNTINLLTPHLDPMDFRARYSMFLEEGHFEVDLLQTWPAEFKIVKREFEKEGQSQRRRLALLSIVCLDPRVDFQSAYNIWDTGSRSVLNNPGDKYILSRAFQCLGFVKLDESFSTKAPSFLAEIQQVFREGKDLERAMKLSFDAIEESPQFEASWGFMSAAWHAAGEDNKALIAARVRLSIAPDSRDALKIYLMHQKEVTSGFELFLVREILSFLNKGS